MEKYIVFNKDRNCYLKTETASIIKASKLAKNLNLDFEEEGWDVSNEHWAHRAANNQKKEDFHKN
jgi:hypothetical protein